MASFDYDLLHESSNREDRFDGRGTFEVRYGKIQNSWSRDRQVSSEFPCFVGATGMTCMVRRSLAVVQSRSVPAIG